MAEPAAGNMHRGIHPLTYPDAIQFLYSLRWFGAKFGLDNTIKLAELAGNPQQQLRFIHVAGTNGKGSVCAMLESIYRAAGLRVGLFTSPHLVAFGERIQVNRQPIPEAEVVRLVAEIQELLEKGWDSKAAVAAGVPPAATPEAPLRDPRSVTDAHPTFFEVVTVLALRYFAAQKCDLVIWETGLGGRLDATNIVTPIASVITNIQFDHQNYLGQTLAEIAGEKAGIIKLGVPVITGTDAPEALEVIRETARQRNAPLYHVTPAEVSQPPLDTLQLPLLGQHQRLNAALALATVRTLGSQIPVQGAAIRTGLSQVYWPGRLQLVTRPSGQKLLLDGAHNVGGAQILAEALKELWGSADISVRQACREKRGGRHLRADKNVRAPSATMVLGILRDKDWPTMCQILAPLARRILLVPVHSERTAEPHGLAEVCLRANPQAEVREYPSLREALESTAQEAFVVIAGSLYLIGEAMELLQLSPATSRDERGLNEWGGAKNPARASK